MSHPPTPRRGFLGRAAAAVLGISALATPVIAQGRAQQPSERWLQGLTGKHRQFFDASSGRGGRALARVVNFYDAYGETYGLKDAELSAIFGAHGDALPLLLNDAMWSKYEFGKRYLEDDPVTHAPAIRNPYAEGWAFSVKRLQERGVRFLLCGRTIRRVGGELAANGGSADQIRAELNANLLPGVTVVPAMIVAINRAQEAGLTYVYLG